MQLERSWRVVRSRIGTSCREESEVPGLACIFLATAATMTRSKGSCISFALTEEMEQGPGARWALVVVDRSGDTPAVLSMARFLFKAMHEAGVDASLPLGELIIPVVGEGSQLDRWTSELGCVERFLLSDRWESRYGAMSEECMLPAALLGVNVIELLIGSAELAIQFRDASFEDNIAMRLACVGHWFNSSIDSA